MSYKIREKRWDQTEEELERSRNKIATALKAAKKRSRRNSNLDDDIDTKFNQLQSFGVELLEILIDLNTDQQADWLHLTEELCQLLVPLEGWVPFMTSSVEQEIRQKDLLQRQKAMMEQTQIIGRKLLFEGKHTQAVLAAVQSLRFSIEVYGLNSVNLVPSYLILVEASIGLGKLSQAEEYLGQAEWTVLKALDSTDAIKSRLYRNMGLLYASKGDYNSSLRMFGEDIYHASKEWGTLHIETSGGYYHMGNVFFRQSNMIVAESLYTQVTDIWFDFLNEAVKKKTALQKHASLLGLTDTDGLQKKILDDTQKAEATHILNAVHEIREQSPKLNLAALSKICHTLSMLYFLLDDMAKAQEFGRKAISASESLPSKVEIPAIATFLPTIYQSENSPL